MSLQLALPRLRSDQWCIVSHPAKYKFIAMGRRWGKTVMAGACAVSWAAAGASIAWVAPTYRNTRPLWRFAEKTVAPLGKAVIVRKADSEIIFPNDGRIGLFSADNPVGILGEKFHAVIIDEAARIGEDVWAETIQPTLADYDGIAMCISTPKGKNWFWREWARGHRGEPGYGAFRAPSRDNPMPTIKEAAEAAKTRVSDRTYRQEWLAEFLDDGGGVFRNVTECATATREERATDGYTYVIGIDWGRITDLTVVIVINATTRSIAAIDTYGRMEFARQIERITSCWQRFNRPMCYVEQNSIGQPMLEAMSRKGIPVRGFYTTSQSKAVIIDELALAFEQRTIAIVNDPVLIEQLQSYEQTTSPSGVPRFGAPGGAHDDYVMALAIGWHHLGRTSSALGAFG
jgi:hypothetical protein